MRGLEAVSPDELEPVSGDELEPVTQLEAAAPRRAVPKPKRATIRLTRRDLAAFAWLVEMKACHEDDLGVLLGRWSGRGPLSASTTRALVDRWRSHGLVEARRVLQDRPRIVSLLPAGAAAAGEPGTWHEVAAWTAMHTAEVAHVRLGLEVELGDRIEEWQAERRLRQETAGLRRKGQAAPHLPDGVIVLTDGQRWAVEVERTAKESIRLARIVQLLTTAYDRTIYATRSRKVAAAVERTYAALRDDTSPTRPLRVNPLQVYPYPERLQR